MALNILHATSVVVADDGTSPVGTNEWNANHTVACTSASTAYAAVNPSGVIGFGDQDYPSLVLVSSPTGGNIYGGSGGPNIFMVTAATNAGLGQTIASVNGVTKNAAGTFFRYGSFDLLVSDITVGSEDGWWNVAVARGGTETGQFNIGDGVVIGTGFNPTFPGAGNLRCDTVKLTDSHTALSATTTSVLAVDGVPVASGGITATTGGITLALTDSCKVVEVLNSSAVSVTVPSSGSVNYPVGTYINISQMGAGVVTITTGTGVTLVGRNGKRTAGQYAMATLYKTTTNTWMVGGDTQV